ncbi:MAG: hypothetical protein K2K68_09385 [Duncaniella sp.]|nr:hypothetical protein [Duncaniella sp.]MDE6581418.1 hypothetical protein [Duncaniella sp.]
MTSNEDFLQISCERNRKLNLPNGAEDRNIKCGYTMIDNFPTFLIIHPGGNDFFIPTDSKVWIKYIKKESLESQELYTDESFIYWQYEITPKGLIPTNQFTPLPQYYNENKLYPLEESTRLDNVEMIIINR